MNLCAEREITQYRKSNQNAEEESSLIINNYLLRQEISFVVTVSSAKSKFG